MEELGLASIDDHASWLGLGASWRQVAHHARTPMHVAMHAWPQKAREHGAIVQLLASKGGHDGIERFERRPASSTASGRPQPQILSQVMQIISKSTPRASPRSGPPPPTVKSSAHAISSSSPRAPTPGHSATAGGATRPTSTASTRPSRPGSGSGAGAASSTSGKGHTHDQQGLAALLAPKDALQAAAEREARAAKVASARLAAVEKRLAHDLRAPLDLNLDSFGRVSLRSMGLERITGDATEWTRPQPQARPQPQQARGPSSTRVGMGGLGATSPAGRGPAGSPAGSSPAGSASTRRPEVSSSRLQRG